jgi:regulator of protease activity HflC (stomatin/prohibitin superfamily)
VPVVVRIRRQPPIRVEFLLLAVALGASGLFLELWLAVRAVIIVGAVLALIAGLLSRIFIRVPPGAVGLTIKGGAQAGVLAEGIHTVSPLVALTHLVTTREIAFDVPVSQVRSADGVAVTVDLMLTLTIADPSRFAYQVATGDADALVHAAAQDAVRATLRGIEALAALDLGAAEAASLRETLDAELGRYGLAVHAVSFTRVTLPEPFTQSLEARRLAAVQLAEAADAFALEQRRIADRGALVAKEAEARLLAVDHEAAAEARRLARLEERLVANPAAARYDLELARIRVAEQLAGNSRAVVSMGAGDLVTSLLVAHEAGAASNGEAPAAQPDTTRSTSPA